MNNKKDKTTKETSAAATLRVAYKKTKDRKLTTKRENLRFPRKERKPTLSLRETKD